MCEWGHVLWALVWDLEPGVDLFHFYSQLLIFWISFHTSCVLPAAYLPRQPHFFFSNVHTIVFFQTVHYRVFASVGRFLLGLARVLEPMFLGLATFIKMENFVSFFFLATFIKMENFVIF